MTIQAMQTQVITVGVDTHQRTHHAVVVDAGGGRLADREFPATEAGYAALRDWAQRRGPVQRYGVESTGSYGAGLTRHLLGAGARVVEVDRPEVAARYRDGKSDPLDALSAARAAASGRANGTPKTTTGTVEALRLLKVPRDGAVKDRTRAYNQMRDLITTAPAPLHDELITLTGPVRVARAARLRPDPARISEPVQAAKLALRTLARRIQALNSDITTADRLINRLTADVVPSLRAMRQVGPQCAARLAITAGQNIDRMSTAARFAKLTGVAPLPAGSGKHSNRHRLNHGGDRHANSALHIIVIGRLKDDPETQAICSRRRAEGKTKPEIIRCLKRHLANRIYRALRTDLRQLDEL
jgi:transposase